MTDVRRSAIICCVSLLCAFGLVLVLPPPVGAQSGTAFSVNVTTVDGDGFLVLGTDIYGMTVTIDTPSGGGALFIVATAEGMTTADVCAAVTREVISGFGFRSGCPGDGTGDAPSAAMGWLSTGGNIVVRFSAPFPVEISAFRVPDEGGGADYSGSYYDVDTIGPTTTTTTEAPTTTTTAPPPVTDQVPWREGENVDLVQGGFVFGCLALFTLGYVAGKS